MAGAMGPVVVKARHQPLLMLPWSAAAPSKTKSFHTPLGSEPVKAERAVSQGGAGAGQLLPMVSKDGGRYVPGVIAAESGRTAEAASSKVNVTAANPYRYPASAIRMTLLPAGPTRRMSRSRG